MTKKMLVGESVYSLIKNNSKLSRCQNIWIIFYSIYQLFLRIIFTKMSLYDWKFIGFVISLNYLVLFLAVIGYHLVEKLFLKKSILYQNPMKDDESLFSNSDSSNLQQSNSFFVKKSSNSIHKSLSKSKSVSQLNSIKGEKTEKFENLNRQIFDNSKMLQEEEMIDNYVLGIRTKNIKRSLSYQRICGYLIMVCSVINIIYLLIIFCIIAIALIINNFEYKHKAYAEDGSYTGNFILYISYNRGANSFTS